MNRMIYDEENKRLGRMSDDEIMLQKIRVILANSENPPIYDSFLEEYLSTYRKSQNKQSL